MMEGLDIRTFQGIGAWLLLGALFSVPAYLLNKGFGFLVAFFFIAFIFASEPLHVAAVILPLTAAIVMVSLLRAPDAQARRNVLWLLKIFLGFLLGVFIIGTLMTSCGSNSDGICSSRFDPDC
jgi:hypothetical protein